MTGILAALASSGNKVSTTFNLTAGNISGASAAGYNDASAGTIGAAGGSVSSNALGNGKTIAELISSSIPNDRLIVKGFSSNPGQSWVSTLFFPVTSSAGPPVTLLGSAATYSYDAPNGAATWLWSGSNLGMLNGNTYTANKLVHTL